VLATQPRALFDEEAKRGMQLGIMPVSLLRCADITAVVRQADYRFARVVKREQVAVAFGGYLLVEKDVVSPDGWMSAAMWFAINSACPSQRSSNSF